MAADHSATPSSPLGSPVDCPRGSAEFTIPQPLLQSNPERGSSESAGSIHPLRTEFAHCNSQARIHHSVKQDLENMGPICPANLFGKGHVPGCNRRRQILPCDRIEAEIEQTNADELPWPRYAIIKSQDLT